MEIVDRKEEEFRQRRLQTRRNRDGSILDYTDSDAADNKASNLTILSIN
jgi:hypothetical protein